MYFVFVLPESQTYNIIPKKQNAKKQKINQKHYLVNQLFILRSQVICISTTQRVVSVNNIIN